MSDSQAGAELEEIDPRVVDRVAEELSTAGSSSTLDQLFTVRDRLAPTIQWSPRPDQLPVEGLRFLLNYWTVARGKAAMAPIGAIDPLGLKPVLGNVIILDVLEGGTDFRFRLFGTEVAAAARYDWTGSTVDEMRRILKGPGPAFYLAVYRAVLRRREPVFTVNAAMAIFKSRSWARLVLPHGDGGQVERILVGNYTIGDTFVSDAEERHLADLREQMRAEREPR